jgi:hypothetical protein
MRSISRVPAEPRPLRARRCYGHPLAERTNVEASSLGGNESNRLQDTTHNPTQLYGERELRVRARTCKYQLPRQ